MEPTGLIYSLISATLVGLTAFAAVVVLTYLKSRWQRVTTIFISLAAGVLIGDVLLHLLPEAIELNSGYTTQLALFILAGIMISLSIEALIHCYNHQHTEGDHNHTNSAAAYLSLMSDTLHNFLDGISIAASFAINPVTGVITTLGIFLHEVPQEIADVAILLNSGWKRGKVLLANSLTAGSAILGVIVFYLLSQIDSNLTVALVGFAVGQLTYVALADLLPEIHKHRRPFYYLTSLISFLTGILLMALLLGVE